MRLMRLAGLQFREAQPADVQEMAQCHAADPDADPADTRMAAYFAGRHHPQHALPARIGFVASINDEVVGYIAGHLTTRHGCNGELQYLFVSPDTRRRGIATELLRLLAGWFQAQASQRICVALAGDSPPQARPFYESVGAVPLQKNWYWWPDIAAVQARSESK